MGMVQETPHGVLDVPVILVHLLQALWSNYQEHLMLMKLDNPIP